MPTSLIPASRNTTPSRTPTAAIEVWLPRRTTQAISSHRIPETRKTPQYRAHCRPIMRSSESILVLPFVRFNPSRLRRYVHTSSESSPRNHDPSDYGVPHDNLDAPGITTRPGAWQAARPGPPGATTLDGSAASSGSRPLALAGRGG